MNTAGWIFMCISWAVILLLFCYTMVRTLRSGADTGEEQARAQESDAKPPVS